MAGILIGLGAMGAYFAPRLYEEFGEKFRVIAGGDRKKRLEENGIVINGTRRYFPVVEPADLVIIAVKGYGLDQAIEDIRNQVGENTVILSVLNGVDSEQRVIEAYGEGKVLYSYMRVSVVMKDGCTSYDPKLGVDLGKEDMDRQESTLMALPFQNKPSTLQDLEAGKRMEIDMFAGTIIEYGRRLGIATPGTCDIRRD